MDAEKLKTRQQILGRVYWVFIIMYVLVFVQLFQAQSERNQARIELSQMRRERDNLQIKLQACNDLLGIATQQSERSK